LIEQGTTPQQRVLVGDLDSLAAMVEQHNIKPPSLIMVGDVISLQDQLGWYQGQEDNVDRPESSAFPFRHKIT
jgi:uroporphyrin-III C-methyltransferase/precorrin-2 dehydrogenase/sirohydrochlorin ferrochelatase